MLTKINSTELYNILSITPTSQNIMLAGRHGIGKSEILKNHFTSIGKKVVTFFCSQAADPGDIIGLPRYNEETGKTEFALPWWFPIDNTPVVLFLDELNRARPEILQVVMDLTLNRTLAGKHLPEGSQIISAVNIGDEYQLTDLDPALLSRFNVYLFEPTPSEWLKWAKSAGVNNAVTSFIESNIKYLDQVAPEDSETMNKYADRRAWCRVSDIMNTNPKFTTALKKLICGIVGAGAGVMFYDYAKNRKTLTPDMLLLDFDNNTQYLSGFTLNDYMSLNTSISSFIQLNADKLEDSSDTMASNLLKYFNYMTGTSGNKEAMAHFISIYEAGNLSDFMIFIVSHPDLETAINEFIMQTNTR